MYPRKNIHQPKMTAEEDAREFVDSILGQPWGVLGAGIDVTKQPHHDGPDPTELPSVCLCDPAGLHHVSGRNVHRLVFFVELAPHPNAAFLGGRHSYRSNLPEARAAPMARRVPSTNG